MFSQAYSAGDRPNSSVRCDSSGYAKGALLFKTGEKSAPACFVLISGHGRCLLAAMAWVISSRSSSMGQANSSRRSVNSLGGRRWVDASAKTNVEALLIPTAGPPCAC